jgi:hypothetical protein
MPRWLKVLLITLLLLVLVSVVWLWSETLRPDIA